MQSSRIPMVLVVIGIISALVYPYTLYAQEEVEFIDCREMACPVQELRRALAESRGLPKKVVVLNVLFAPNTTAVRPQDYPTLNTLGETLATLPDVSLAIAGHTDSLGSATVNKVLSAKRAESVKNYLITRFSIQKERLIAKGYGKDKPKVSNDTPQGRTENRRVEVARASS